jgi:hypothetical protein
MMMGVLFASKLLFLDFLEFIVNVFRFSIVNKEIIFEVEDGHFVTCIILLRNLRGKLRLVVFNLLLNLWLLRLLLA